MRKTKMTQKGNPKGSWYEGIHGKVRYAIKTGKLAKLDGTIKCVDCSNIATQYDHRDYLKPLEVEPVCAGCNSKRGSGKNRPKNPYPHGKIRCVVSVLVPEELYEPFKAKCKENKIAMSTWLKNEVEKWVV